MMEAEETVKHIPVNTFPLECSHMLFQNNTPGEMTFYLAENWGKAMKLGDKDYPIGPAAPSELLAKYGHDGMRRILERFGAFWISAQGRLYFRRHNV